MLAKAVANELQYSYMSLKGSDIESDLVGQNLKRLRAAFRVAKRHAPCVLLFGNQILRNKIQFLC